MDPIDKDICEMLEQITKEADLAEKAVKENNSVGTTYIVAEGQNPMMSQNATNELSTVCAEFVATIPSVPRRVECVDIAQLAGTVVNPIPSVSVPSWSPQVNFTKKEGKHICPGCGKGFNNIGNMKQHIKVVHDKVKDFECRFCAKRFGMAQTLKHHEWIHTGERPYVCKTCGVCFRQDSALKRHQKVHQNRPRVRRYSMRRV